MWSSRGWRAYKHRYQSVPHQHANWTYGIDASRQKLLI